MKQTQSNFNFFKHIEASVQVVERQSYKKIITLAGGFGLVFGLIFSIAHYSHADDLAQKHLYEGKIGSITPEQCADFIHYYHMNQDMYHRRINILINAYLASNNESKVTHEATDDADKVGTILAQDFNERQTDDNNNMVSFQNTYQLIKNHQAFDMDSAKLFSRYYDAYLNKAIYHFPTIDKALSGYGYPNNVGDINYFTKNHIYTQIQDDSLVAH